MHELELREVQTVADTLHTRRESTDAFEQALHLVARLTGLDFKIHLPCMDMRDVNALIELIEEQGRDPRKPAPKADTSAS